MGLITCYSGFMKRWFIAFSLVVVGSVHAWTAEGYDKEIRSTIAEMDAHYTQEMKAVYISGNIDILEKKVTAAAIQKRWTAQRLQVVSDMQNIQVQLKSYEERQINSSIRIRAKLQQTLGEIQQWRNSELGRIQTLTLPTEEKARERREVNNVADARSNQIQVSAVAQEQALRKLNERADKRMFSAKEEISFFALQQKK